MMYLDMVNGMGVEPGPAGARFMRVRDDRFPGEELLIPVAGGAETVEPTDTTPNQVPLALLPGKPLLEPF